MEQTIVKKDSFRWVMLLFICLFYYVVLGFANQAFNILLATITKDMGWTAVQRTAVATAMSSGMIWFVFIAGALLDRFSVKKILTVTILIVAVLLFIRGQAQGFMFWFVIMFLFGVASAFYMPACTKTIGLWFDTSELAYANGWLTAASPLGQITANLFAVKIMTGIGGWKMLYMMVGVCVVVIVGFFFFIAKDRKSEDSALTSTIIKTADLGFWKNIKGILKVPMVWVYCIANMCFLGAIYAGGTYGQLVFQTDPRWMLDKAISGQIPAFNNFASMFAYVLVPMLIAKVGRQHYTKFAIVAGVVAPICFMLGYRSYNFAFVCAMMLIAGIFYGAIVPAPKVLMLQLPEVSGPRAGTALGLYVTIERIGITIATGVLGGMISAAPATSSDVLANFWSLQIVAPICILIGAVYLKRKAAKKATADNTN
jgi:MFS family permease